MRLVFGNLFAQRIVVHIDVQFRAIFDAENATQQDTSCCLHAQTV
jgi:hypothetical protein